MPRSKCLTPPPAAAAHVPVDPPLVAAPAGCRAGTPGGELGVLKPGPGAVPLHFCQCLTSWRPTLGAPLQGDTPFAL